VKLNPLAEAVSTAAAMAALISLIQKALNLQQGAGVALTYAL
jgi:hypothetical protein